MKAYTSMIKKKMTRTGEAIVSKVVGIALGVMVVACMFPLALNMLANSTLYKVNPAVSTVLMTLLPILAVIGVALMFLKYSKH